MQEARYKRRQIQRLGVLGLEDNADNVVAYTFRGGRMEGTGEFKDWEEVKLASVGQSKEETLSGPPPPPITHRYVSFAQLAGCHWVCTATRWRHVT